MTSTRMRPGQDPDEYLYHMDSCLDHLNASDPPDGPTDRQYEDIILQALASEYDRIRQPNLKRRDLGLADIRRMMAATYADNLSRSESSKGIARCGAAVQAVDRDRTSILCHYYDQFGRFKESAHSESNTSSSSGSSQFGIISNNSSQHQQKPCGRRQNNSGGGGGRVWCSYHKTTSHNDADCRAQQHKAGGNARLAAARTQRVKRVYSAPDLTEEDDKLKRPYVSSATEVQSDTEPATAPRQKNRI